jgi:hypothetical protein
MTDITFIVLPPDVAWRISQLERWSMDYHRWAGFPGTTKELYDKLKSEAKRCEDEANELRRIHGKKL